MKKAPSMELLHPKVKLMYFLWKRSGFSGSISELARQLGYKDASPVNRMLHELIDDGYVLEQAKSRKTAFRLTKRGQRSISLLVFKDFSLLFLIVFSVAVVYSGFAGLIFHVVVPSADLVIMGTVSILFVILVRQQIRNQETQLWSSDLEGAQ
jgi:magnesium-transporting ATPase (P-type)